MNKKIKMIELLNMIAKGELKDKTKFKVYSSCNDEDSKPFICEYGEAYPGIIWYTTDDCKYNYKIDYMRILNYYVEILEDNTEEIETYKGESFEQLGYEVGKMSMEIAKGLEKAIKEMRKENTNVNKNNIH